MAIVSLREMLEDARRGGYAVPLFDTQNMAMIRSAVQVAEEENSPVIIAGVEFDYEGETVMLAPASGFYSDPTCGRNEVRIAYVLCQQDLQRAIRVLGEALKRYRREVMGEE